MNLECEFVQNMLHEYFDGELNEEMNERIDKHLRRCPKCASIYHKIANLSSLIKHAFFNSKINVR